MWLRLIRKRKKLPQKNKIYSNLSERHFSVKYPKITRIQWIDSRIRDGTVVESVPVLFLPFEIRFSGWERKQPGDMYCVRTVGAASALRARLLRSYVPLRRDRVKTRALTIHISRRTLSHSDKSGIFLMLSSFLPVSSVSPTRTQMTQVQSPR